MRSDWMLGSTLELVRRHNETRQEKIPVDAKSCCGNGDIMFATNFIIGQIKTKDKPSTHIFEQYFRSVKADFTNDIIIQNPYRN